MYCHTSAPGKNKSGEIFDHMAGVSNSIGNVTIYLFHLICCIIHVLQVSYGAARPLEKLRDKLQNLFPFFLRSNIDLYT